jgi:hypothetical protein
MLERRSLMKGVENQAGRVAELLAVSAASPLFTFNQDNLTSAAQAFGSDPAIRFLKIKDASRKVVAPAGDAKNQTGITLATQSAAEELARMAAELQALVGQFKCGEEADTRPVWRGLPAPAGNQPVYRPEGATVHSIQKNGVME